MFLLKCSMSVQWLAEIGEWLIGDNDPPHSPTASERSLLGVSCLSVAVTPALKTGIKIPQSDVFIRTHYVSSRKMDPGGICIYLF